MHQKISFKVFLQSGLLLMLCLIYSLPSCIEKRLPNIVLIFMDDMGYADIGSFGAKGYQTPNLDRMANEGMRFTDFHVSQAVCSASRAALLTGCYSERVGIQGALRPSARIGLNPQEETIAELLKERGYSTAIIGKWHLGQKKEFLPTAQGFDEYFGLPYSNDMWPVGFDGKPIEGMKSTYPRLPLIEGTETIDYIENLDDQAQLTTKYTERAVQFIEKNKNNPFFLYLPHSMTHVPLGVSEKFKGKSEQGMYGDVMMEIDWSVGQILETLKKNNLDENTLVIFTSDNGPWLNFGNHAGSAHPLREGKGNMWEGGARVPALMRWPGEIPAGETCDKLAATIDILPTLCNLTGAPLSKNKIDGVNIWPLISGEKDVIPRREYFYYYTKQLRAVRQDNWKLMFPHQYRSYAGVEPGKDGFPGPYSRRQSGLELYNLQDDIGETTDLAKKHPEIVRELQELGEKAREDLGDALTKREGNGVREPGRLQQENRKGKIIHKAVDKKIEYKFEYSSKYPAEGNMALINSTLGSLDFNDGRWQAFEAADLDVVIDLGTVQSINKISCGFMQDIVSWIFFPENVTFFLSDDGVSFKKIKSIPGGPEMTAEVKIKEYSATNIDRKARFIRVRAQNINTCPKWHSGAGGKAWIFTDEIIVD